MSLIGGGRSDRAGDSPDARPATRSEVIAPHAMVATSQPLATQVGLELLRAGGSAVDAAIAANAALGLMEPTGCGVGGDLFALVWSAREGRLVGLNASGRSPLGLDLDGLRAALRRAGCGRIPATGPWPVTVPGAVDGWMLLHGRFGRLPLERVLAPAIDYARHGFPLSEVISGYWAQNAAALRGFPRFAETFLPQGRAPRKGELFRNPRLADTYAAIASGGREAFYGGAIARTIAQAVTDLGGALSAEDLAAHHSEWVEPLSTRYRGYDVWQLPPNTQGLAVLEMLNVLEGYDLAGMGFGSVEAAHLLIEAKKLAFEDRARFYADPAFAAAPLERLASKAYAAVRRGLLSSGSAAQAYPAGDPRIDHGDTVYLAAADSRGDMVSLIQSNYRGMGSGVTPAGLGFVLQDRGELFSLDPAHPNVFAPGKRPFHTIIPGFVTRAGAPWLAFGVMGGAMQPQGQVQILVNLIDHGMNLQEAGDAPRLRHQGSSEPTGEVMREGGEVVIEPGFAPGHAAGLAARGHRVRIARDGDFGGYQAVMRDAVEGVYVGASESRKDGQAGGF